MATAHPGRGGKRIAQFVAAFTAIAAIGLLSAASSPAGFPSPLPTGNLIKNPGAEADSGSATGIDDVDLSNWTERVGAPTAVVYGASGFPTNTESAGIGGGSNFFAGGDGAAKSVARQVVRIPASIHDHIDNGQVQANWSAYLGVSEGQRDTAAVRIAFLDATGATLLGPFVLGPVSGEGTTTGFSLEGGGWPELPAGVRKVRVKQVFIRHDGTYNDGYADNLSLILDFN